MAKCNLPKGILSISGKLGGMIFKTYTRPDGTTETRAYPNPYRQHGYQRTTRTITTKSEYYQRGDTSCIIQTKTVESYDASKKL